jgi:hypothetical protein
MTVAYLLRLHIYTINVNLSNTGPGVKSVVLSLTVRVVKIYFMLEVNLQLLKENVDEKLRDF